MVDPIIGTKRLSKVLMDGGSGLNIMYAKMLDAKGISRSRIRSTRAPFHGIMPGKQAVPLGTETLTFEVVGFHGTYHAILRRPCFVKFMGVPNYTYLKLKMLGPGRVITAGTSFQRAYECEVECYDHAAAIIASKELAAIRKEVIEETPDHHWSAGSFKPMEGAKEVLIDPSSSKSKVVHIGTVLSSK
ncbi:uncharacterized protein [Miscanthus floridulus]|uniref:uncharacterized protein n=1 Tax=Miscanthus floridulus TaxID=154761 RepID=UPI003458D7ED